MYFRKTVLVMAAPLVMLGALLAFVTMTPVVRLTASVMQQGWYDGGGEVLVVLGGSMLVPGTGPDATMGDDTYLRCVYASWILRRQHFRHVIVSGGGGLAKAMAGYLVKSGVDNQEIWQEARSFSTYENAVNTKHLLERQYGTVHLPAVVVLTSDYHSWRARRTFEHCGLPTSMIAIPDVIKRSGALSYRWTGAITVVDEFAKDLFYITSGKL